MNESVKRAQGHVVKGKERLLTTLSFVPDDQLTWSPSPTAKSALRIAAHCGVTNAGFASLLRGQEAKADSLEELVRFFEREEKKIASREQALKLIEDSTSEVLAAIEALTPEMIASEVKGPFGSMPMTFWMGLPGVHMQNHAAQIDYLQTIWGDLEFHL